MALRVLEGGEPGVPVNVVCPLCQGALTFSEHRGFHQLRCHVGHAFSLESLALARGVPRGSEGRLENESGGYSLLPRSVFRSS